MPGINGARMIATADGTGNTDYIVKCKRDSAGKVVFPKIGFFRSSFSGSVLNCYWRKASDNYSCMGGGANGKLYVMDWSTTGSEINAGGTVLFPVHLIGSTTSFNAIGAVRTDIASPTDPTIKFSMCSFNRIPLSTNLATDQEARIVLTSFYSENKNGINAYSPRSGSASWYSAITANVQAGSSHYIAHSWTLSPQVIGTGITDPVVAPALWVPASHPQAGQASLNINIYGIFCHF